jgi:hypothetical protein
MKVNISKHSIGYFLELAKKDGFEGKDAFKKWNEWRRQNGKMPDYTRIDKEKNEKIAKNMGYKDLNEYGKESREKYAQDKGYKDFNEYVKENRNVWAQDKGYDNYNDRRNENDWEKGKRLPMSINEDCSLYIGVYIGEIRISEIFDNVKIMPPNNIGFDWICGKGYRIQVKTTTLTDGRWPFCIRYNDRTDYFLLVALDINLSPTHLWLIGKEEFVRKGTRRNGYTMEKMYNRDSLNIYDNEKSSLSFKYFSKYEWINKLDMLKEYCNKQQMEENKCE